MIYIIGINTAFFLGLLLLSKKHKTQADKILSCWLLVIGVHLLLFYLYFSKLLYNYPYLLGVDAPFPLLHGPFLYLYTASLTNQIDRKKGVYVHFVPVIICYLYLISFFRLPASQKDFIFQNKGLGFENFLLVKIIAIAVSGITYTVCSIVLLKRHRKAILSQFSYTEKINLQWLQYLIYGFSFIWLLLFADDEFLFAAVVFFVLFIGYFGIKQVGIFTNLAFIEQLALPSVNDKPGRRMPTTDSLVNSNKRKSFLHEDEFLKPDTTNPEKPQVVILRDDNSEKKKYSKSGLTEEMAENLHSKLARLMNEEKIFTESELSLPELANRLETLPNYVSQIINEKERKTFYDYINTLRIEEFKRLISIPENKKYTMLSLSYDCGFNSKSSFNKNFKKATGQSPSEYLNSLNTKKD